MGLKVARVCSQRCSVARPLWKGDKSPITQVKPRRTNVEQTWSRTRQKAHFHVSEEVRYAFPGRLKPCFLACPQVHEGFRFLVSRQCAKELSFAWGKKTLNKCIRVFRKARGFNVDAYRFGIAECENGVSARMRKIELQLGTAEMRLSKSGIVKFQFARGAAQVTGQDDAQGATSRYITLSMPAKVEALRAVTFIRRKNAAQLLNDSWTRGQMPSPDVNVRRGQLGRGSCRDPARLMYCSGFNHRQPTLSCRWKASLAIPAW